MKTWEALKALGEGKKVRLKYWGSGRYIYRTENGRILDNTEDIVFLNLTSEMIDGEWEVYEKKTIDKWLNPTCYEYGGFSCECPVCHKTTLITKTPEFPNLIYYCMYCGTKNIVKE